MTFKILWHSSVAQDLENILTLILDYSGPTVARRKIREIEAGIRSLAEVPHRGTIRDEIYPGLRVLPVARKGVMCFTVDDATKTVRLMAVTYAGQEWGRLLSTRRNA